MRKHGCEKIPTRCRILKSLRSSLWLILDLHLLFSPNFFLERELCKHFPLIYISIHTYKETVALDQLKRRMHYNLYNILYLIGEKALFTYLVLQTYWPFTSWGVVFRSFLDSTNGYRTLGGLGELPWTFCEPFGSKSKLLQTRKRIKPKTNPT